MAELARIVRRNPISQFQQAAPEGGTAFRALAGMARQAYEWLEPAAMHQMAQRADGDGWRELARQHIGSNRAFSLASSTSPDAIMASRSDASPASMPLTGRTRGGRGWTEVVDDDGAVTRRTGSRSWRNNNPGNIEYGAFARRHGAMGSDGRFAVFPTVEAGRAAMSSLLFESPSYRGLTIQGAVNRYAPPTENDSRNYAAGIASALGLPASTPLSALSPEQRNTMLDTMQRIEGWTPGREERTGGTSQPTPQNVQDAATQRGGLRRFTPQTISIYGAGDQSRALIRLPNGARVTLSVGDELPDGRIVTGISEDRIQTSDGDVVPQSQGQMEVTLSSSGSAVPDEPAPPPGAVVRTAEGNLEPRLYSPLSGPILQAYNAAAQIAYQSELMQGASVALMDMSVEHTGNPQAYQQAAQEYIDGLVDQAPEMFRSELREGLSREAHRRFAGMVEERHRDIRQRANNASQALTQRWQAEYAEALASGDEDAVASARQQLEGILAAREQLPGVAWTPEQSENVFIDAERTADRIRSQRFRDASSEINDTGRLVRDSLRRGQSASDEGAYLSNPFAFEADPDLYREVQALVEARAAFPGFAQLSPGERESIIEELRAQPVEDRGQFALIDALESMDSAISDAFEEDPIKAAQEYFPNPPIELPAFDPQRPGPFIEALTQRIEYAEAMAQEGYTDEPVFFSQDEHELLAALAGNEDSIVRGLFAAVTAQAGSPALMEQLGLDPALRMAGSLVASGVSERVATEAASGLAIISENTGILPSRNTLNTARMEAFGGALRNVPGWETAEGGVQALARALYANMATQEGIDDPNSDAARDLMKTALQRALGQEQTPRGTTGGIQEVFGERTLLPPGVRASHVEAAVERALGLSRRSVYATALIPFGRVRPRVGPDDARDDVWRADGTPMTPMWGAAPLVDYLRTRPSGLNDLTISVFGSEGGRPIYRMSMRVGNHESIITDQNGLPFVFRINDLIERAR